MSCCFEFLGASSTAGAQESASAGDKSSKAANDGHSTLVAAVRSSREFLQQKHTTSREAVNCFLELASLACGLDLYFYSSTESRGRQNVILDDESSSSFRLIATSAKSVADCSTGIPADHEAVLDRPCSVQTAQVVSSYGLEGLLLVDCQPSSVPATLADAVGIWASVLGERLSLIETMAELESSQEAVDSTLEVVSGMVFRAQSGEYDACMQVGSSLEHLLKVFIDPEGHTVWSLEREEDELVQNNTGKYDGPRVPVAESIVGMPLGTHQSKVVCMQHCERVSFPEVAGTSSTICIPLTLPFDEVSASLSWRRTSAYVYNREAESRESMARQSISAVPNIGEDIAVIQLSWSNNGEKKTQRPFDHFDLVSAEALPDSVLPKMLQMRDLFQRLDEVASQRVGLINVMKILSKAATVTEVALMVENEVAQALHCEVCTFFFIDDKHDEIWAPPKDTIPNGLCMAFGVGLVGHVAKQARLAKDDDEKPQVVVTNDPRSCPHWNGDVAGFTTRNIMTSPVWSHAPHGGDRRLLGVIQILNKSQGKSSHDFGFTKVDAEFLQLLSTGVGETLERLLLDVMCAKINLDTHHHSKRSAPSMVGEYYVSGGSAKTVYRANECLAVAMTMNKEKALQDELAFKKIFTNTSEVRPDANVRNWLVDYWSLTLEEQFRLVLHALEECDSLNQLPVSQASLYNFFVGVRDTYRDMPYHNFWHALATVHYSCRMLHAAGVKKNLTEADLFAIIIGALCHDCDHRGHNTAFEVATRSELAIRYNDNSPLENHHCAVAFDVAFGEDEKNNIFKQMSPEVYINIRHRMIAGILSTDMKCHGDHVKLVQTFELREGVDNNQSQFLVELFMHAADIGNPFMPPDISQRWGAAIAEEFTLQVEHEREQGLPVTSFMDGLSDPVAAAKSQVGFIDFVIAPLVDPLFRIFEGLSEPKKYLAENRARIKQIVDEGNPEKIQREA